MTDEERYPLWALAGLNLGLYEVVRPTDVHAGLALDRLLGVKIYEEWLNTPDHLKEPLPYEIFNLLKMLCGPHAKAVLKAYQIRKGIE